MELLVQNLIEFQKMFQQQFLDKMESQNKLMEKQNTLLERLLDKFPEFGAKDRKRKKFTHKIVESHSNSGEAADEEALEDNETLFVPEPEEEYMEEEEQDNFEGIHVKEEDVFAAQSYIHIEDQTGEEDRVVRFPIDDINTLLEVEEEAQQNNNEKFIEHLTLHFKKAVPPDEKRFLNCGLAKIITDEVISMLNWNGEHSKIGMSSMKIFNEILQNAWSSKFKTEDDYLRVIKLQLRAAKRRINTKNCRSRSALKKSL